MARAADSTTRAMPTAVQAGARPLEPAQPTQMIGMQEELVRTGQAVALPCREKGPRQLEVP